MENIVEKYLEENKNLKLSIKSLHKRLDIKKKYVVYLVNKSNKLRRVDPLEVGSLKQQLCVYTFI